MDQGIIRMRRQQIDDDVIDLAFFSFSFTRFGRWKATNPSIQFRSRLLLFVVKNEKRGKLSVALSFTFGDVDERYVME